jgi:hypothetical protein
VNTCSRGPSGGRPGKTEPPGWLTTKFMMAGLFCSQGLLGRAGRTSWGSADLAACEGHQLLSTPPCILHRSRPARGLEPLGDVRASFYFRLPRVPSFTSLFALARGSGAPHTLSKGPFCFSNPSEQESRDPFRKENQEQFSPC